MSLQAISFDLQITPGSIPPVLHMSQYDSGRQFTAYLKDETNTAFAPGTGATAKIKGFNAAGVAWEQAATVDGSTVVFTPSGAATDQFGVMPVTIEITVGEEVLTPLLVVFDIQRAGYTNEEAVRSPEFQTALEAAVAAAIEEGGLGFSDDFKEALLACFAHVAWADEEGQTYYDALYDALYPGPAPVTLVSITADYEQDRPIYDTDDLDAIKAGDDLTVTANYSDGSSEVLGDDDYTLSGTLTVGTSTITVSYAGKTTTISVLVSERWSYSLSDLIKVTGPLVNSSEANCGIALATEEPYRRSFMLGYGATSVALRNTSGISSQTSDYFPVKIPAGAKSFDISITPNTQQVQCLARQLNNGVYSTLSSTGWSGYQAGGGTKTLAEVAGDNAYIFLSTKYDSAGTSYPVEPTAFSVVFHEP